MYYPNNNTSQMECGGKLTRASKGYPLGVRFSSSDVLIILIFL